MNQTENKRYYLTVRLVLQLKIEKLRLLEALEQGLTDEVIRGMLEKFEYIFDFGVTDNNLIIYEKPGNDTLMTISVYDASFDKIGNKIMVKSYTFNHSLKVMSCRNKKYKLDV